MKKRTHLTIKERTRDICKGREASQHGLARDMVPRYAPNEAQTQVLETGRLLDQLVYLRTDIEDDSVLEISSKELALDPIDDSDSPSVENLWRARTIRDGWIRKRVEVSKALQV